MTPVDRDKLYHNELMILNSSPYWWDEFEKHKNDHNIHMTNKKSKYDLSQQPILYHTLIHKNVYLIYEHQGNICIRNGNIYGYDGRSKQPMYKQFYAKNDRTYNWRDGIDGPPLTLTTERHNHIWCKSAKDIDKAVEILMTYLTTKPQPDPEGGYYKPKYDMYSVKWLLD